MAEAVFRSRMSGWIAGLYWGLLVFVGLLFAGLGLLGGLPPLASMILIATFGLVLILFVSILYRAYGMRFTIAGEEIVIRGVFKTNRIRRKDVKNIKKVPIPVGFRLFGASFLGGWYYLPGIGGAWVSMTNFRDGVLMTTRDGRHFVITPENPLKFIREAKAR